MGKVENKMGVFAATHCLRLLLLPVQWYSGTLSGEKLVLLQQWYTQWRKAGAGSVVHSVVKSWCCYSNGTLSGEKLVLVQQWYTQWRKAAGRNKSYQSIGRQHEKWSPILIYIYSFTRCLFSLLYVFK